MLMLSSSSSSLDTIADFKDLDFLWARPEEGSPTRFLAFFMSLAIIFGTGQARSSCPRS
uniref:Uncharacterized protein n=1 Tax=Arundo donax TaxID=35708 RepID=A0A0A9AXV0_ARUDO